MSYIMSGVITNGKYWTTDCIRHPKRRLCVCCPNGAHIDVDFDMFYKTLTKMQQQPHSLVSDVTTTTTTTTTSTTKQYKHFRRKQDPTIDALLGYRNKSQSTVDIDEIVYKSRDMPAMASPDVQESLEQALHDFEETLIRSSTTDVRSPLVSPLLTNQFSSSFSLRSDTKSDSLYKSMNGDRYSNSFEPITTPPEMFRSSTESIRTESTRASSEYRRIQSPSIPTSPQLSEPRIELDSPPKFRKFSTSREFQIQLESLPTSSVKPQTEDVAVNCSVPTRDIGTSCIPALHRTIATNTINAHLTDASTMTQPARKESISSFNLNQILDDDQVRKVATVGTQTYSRVSSLVIIEKRDQGIQTETESNDSPKLRSIFEEGMHKRSIATSTDLSRFNFDLQPIIENRRLYSKHSQTKDVLVRERVHCKKVASQTECENLKYKDSSVNTPRKRLVDASTGDSPTSSPEWCEKCKQTRNNGNSPGSPVGNSINQSVSKIPRPKSLQTGTNSNKKKMLMRQDTYVTIPSPELERLKELQSRESISNSQTDLSRFDSVNAADTGKSYKTKNDSFFVPIIDNRAKSEPSQEMKAAMKVLNDSIKKPDFQKLKETSLRNAIGIIQQEWFKISSLSTADPLVVEDYLDTFEAVSTNLLEFIVNSKDGAGNTAMHYAVSHGNFDIVSILLDSKVCDINIVNDAGYTCIMLVSLAQIKSNTHCDVIRRLFDMADVNKRAKQHGQTTLMLAASHGKLDIVKLLLESGADLNIQDDDGSTALMCAAEHGYLDIVNVLATHPDADLTIKDNDGSTALTIAMEAGHREIGIAIYTRQHFADLNNPPAKEKRSRSANPILMEHRRTLRSAPTSPSPIA